MRYTLFFSCLVALSALASCNEGEDKAPAPEIETLPLTNITLTSATAQANIVTDHPELITARGFCWGQVPAPSFQNVSSRTKNGVGSGTFQAELKGFILTTYYVRAYIEFQNTIYYGNEIVLNLSAMIPSIETQVPTDLTDQSAKVATKITYVHSEPVVEKGICWGTTPVPEIEKNTKIVDDGTSLQFSSLLTPLAPLTAYYARGYAITSLGIFYGNVVQIYFLPPPVYHEVNDVDGNTYKTVVIGNQEWMAENLRVTKFNDGTALPALFSEADFKNATGGAYTAYESNQGNITTFGLLYNGFVANASKNVCPQDWRVPSPGDWYQLTTALGGLETAGGRMKAVSATWATPNEGATNASGFSGLPGGSYCRVCIGNNGVFADKGTDGYWWSSQSGTFFYLTNNLTEVRTKNTALSNDGMSIRCVK